MGRRDYEMEDAVKAVEGQVAEPIVRALLVGSAGSSEGPLGGALKSLFGRSRRKAGLHSRNALVLTTTSIRVFACDAHGWPPRRATRLARGRSARCACRPRPPRSGQPSTPVTAVPRRTG